MKRTYTLPSLLALGASGSLLVLAASCADSDETGPSATDGGTTLVEGGMTPSADAATDGDADASTGCDAADPSCTSHVLSCAEADWCLVPEAVSSSIALKTIWGSKRDDVWAGGSDGTVVHYDGTTWATTPSGSHRTINAIWGSGPSDVYAVSAITAVFHTTGFQGAATTWTSVPTFDQIVSPTAPEIWAVWGTSASDVMLAGREWAYFAPDDPWNAIPSNIIRKSTPDVGESGWAAIAGQGTIRSIWGAAAGDAWVVVDRSTSSGKSWQTAVTLHQTIDADGVIRYREFDSQSADALQSVHGSSSSDVWVVGTHGAIRHITPSDQRWQVVDSPTTAALYRVWASAPNDVWAVGESGTILHYDGQRFVASTAQLPLGEKPTLYGIWGSAPNDVWIVGDGVVLHYTGPKTPAEAK